jgi:hypothetical protein
MENLQKSYLVGLPEEQGAGAVLDCSTSGLAKELVHNPILHGQKGTILSASRSAASQVNSRLSLK